MTHPLEREIFYVGDPMCSWCWGFAPVVERIREGFPEAGFTVVLGGLRAGKHAEPLDARLKRRIEPHWRRVAEISGQPFDFGFFDREGFLFDTEPPCRAVVTVRALAPEKTFPFFRALEEAFYARNVDITDASSYGALLEQQGIDSALFMESFESDRLRRETSNDFVHARRLGAQGFPTVVLRRGQELALLTVGSQPYERLEPAIERYFAACLHYS
jgi:putative protein-disulfide isomerase